MINELPAERLRNVVDPHALQCRATDTVSPMKEILGQKRAVNALKFGLDIKEKGFNVYAAGAPGTGKTTAVKSYLDEMAKVQPVPYDWCYVYSFRDSYHPKALRLPPGKGKELKKDMESILSEARKGIPNAFEGKDYIAKISSLNKVYENERQEAFSKLEEMALSKNFMLQITPVGPIFVPLVKGKPMAEEAFSALDAKTKKALQENQETLNAEMRETVRVLREEEHKLKEEISKLNKDVALYAIGHLTEHLVEKYKDLPDVIAYIKEVQNDFVQNLEQFRRKTEAQPQIPFPFPWMAEPTFKKYEVNVIVDNSDLKGAPVIVEQNPNYNKLFGRLEKEAQLGMLTTDFTMIIAGSIHKANGGYLVLRVEEVLRDAILWNSLKSALKGSKITIEEPAERLGYIAVKSLAPEPIPLEVKVVLIGDWQIYQLLLAYDPEFIELFKVKAEFDTTMDRTDDRIREYVSLICTICEKEKLKHLDSTGVAKIVEYSSRLAEDQTKLSTRFAVITDVLREASYYAAEDSSKYINAGHIKRAVEERVFRSNLIHEKIKEFIERGIFLIDTKGEAVGQINGLSVISLGDVSFGRPSRVTASVSLGREGVVDIERKVRMGGPIHSKGVMILAGFLGQRYAQDKPLSLSARLVFEQSYEGVEGDSASSTELYSILSRLADVPIKQSLAVTGSVNQNGEVQAIGGINQKIEGFFEVCKAQGLTGQQGVVMPESNVQNLMLREEVLEAVKNGQFHIYAVKSIDEGIEVLTGVKGGTRLQDGSFEKGSINYRVDQKLREMAEKLRSFGARAKATEAA